MTVVIDVGEHLAHDPECDVYQRLYEAAGVEPPAATRDKPPCCDETGPPVDAEEVDQLRDDFKELTKRRRRPA